MNTPNTPKPIGLRANIEARAADIMPHIEDPKYVHEQYEKVMGLMLTLCDFLRTEKNLSPEERETYTEMRDKLEAKLDEEDNLYQANTSAVVDEEAEEAAVQKAVEDAHRALTKRLKSAVPDMVFPPKPPRRDE